MPERSPSPFGHFPNKLGKNIVQKPPSTFKGSASCESFPNLLGKCPKGDGGFQPRVTP